MANTNEREAFPVASLNEALPLLRRPFTPAAVKFKLQSAPRSKQQGKGVVVAYIDARLDIERLNLVVGGAWSDQYDAVHGGLECALTLYGVTRRDVGEGSSAKGLRSDAFKRAGVRFGIGVSIYAVPKMWADPSDCRWQQQQSGGEKAVGLTSEAEKKFRKGYEQWLKQTGIPEFGEPIDHGDVEDTQGDDTVADAPIDASGNAAPEQAVQAPTTTAVSNEGEPLITPAQVTLIERSAKKHELDERSVSKLVTEVSGQPHLDKTPRRLFEPLMQKVETARAAA